MLSSYMAEPRFTRELCESLLLWLRLQQITIVARHSGGSRGGAQGSPPQFWVKKENITEEKLAGQNQPPPPLSSRSRYSTETHIVT